MSPKNSKYFKSEEDTDEVDVGSNEHEMSVDWGDKESFSVVEEVSSAHDKIAVLPPQQPVVDDTKPLRSGPTVTLRAVNLDVIGGCLLMYQPDNSENAWYVPLEYVRVTSRDQEVPQSVLATCKRPYGWYEEIKSLFITEHEVRLGLYRNGYREQQPLKIREVVANLVKDGTLPIKKGV